MSGYGNPGSHDDSGDARKKGLTTIVVLGVVLVLVILLFASCSSGRANAADCGDYDLENGEYVSDPGDGEYEKVGDDYQYVGCDDDRTRSGSSGGGFFFFGTGGSSGYSSGGSSSGGSGFRGGGSGFGK